MPALACWRAYAISDTDGMSELVEIRGETGGISRAAQEWTTCRPAPSPAGGCTRGDGMVM